MNEGDTKIIRPISPPISLSASSITDGKRLEPALLASLSRWRGPGRLRAARTDYDARGEIGRCVLHAHIQNTIHACLRVE